MTAIAAQLRETLSDAGARPSSRRRAPAPCIGLAVMAGIGLWLTIGLFLACIV